MEAAMSSNSTHDSSPGDVAQASVIIVLGILVCFCSLLTILAVHKFRSVSNPDVLILALAIIDFISSFTVFPLAAYWYLRTGEYFSELCLVYGALTTTIQLASTVVVSLMTIDRFLAIRKPIFYRTRLGNLQLKRLVVIIVVVSAVIGCLPAALSATNWTSVTNRHGYCTFKYTSDFTFVILAISLPQIPLLVYCYYGFLVSIRKFMRRRQPNLAPSPASSSASLEMGRRNNSSRSVDPAGGRLDTLISRCHIYCCCCCCGLYSARQRKAASKEDVVEKTQTMMKNMHLRRCTRMSKTVALVVVIYYIPWILALITMTIELITKLENYYSTLNLVMVRLMMAHSIFYPVIYATLCDNYKLAYKWALSLPFQPCGVAWSERPPLGLTVSEMHRISHQMALEEWESPGLNRRLYSKRPYLKRSTTDSLRDATNGESDAGHDNSAFDTTGVASTDPTVEDAQITVEVVQENAVRQISTEDPAPSVSAHQIVPIESPRLHNRSFTKEQKQGCSAPRRPLENQTSDSGVDVDSIHLDSGPSSSNSPAVMRLQTVESESSTSVSDVSERLSRVDPSNQETVPVVEASDHDGLKPTSHGETETNDQRDANSKVLQYYDVRSDEIPQNPNTRNADVRPNSTDATAENNVKAKNDDVTALDTTTKSTSLESNSKGYSIKETTPGRNSILRIEPCSAGDQCQGLVRIHVEVVELRPDSPPLAPGTCSLQSNTRQCHVKPVNQRPSLKFSMKKNRFVPSTSSFEETDSYSLDLSGKDVDHISNTVSTPVLNIPDETLPKDDATNVGPKNNTTKTNGDVLESELKDDPPSKGFKSRRMRASRALRESARYQDDIVHFSEMIMRRQNKDKVLPLKNKSNKTRTSELHPDGSEVIVTDHLDL